MAPSTITARRLNQAVYVAVASARRDPVLDLVAGVAAEMLRAHQGMSAAAAQEAITALHTAAVAARPAPGLDTALDDATRMMRVLVRVVPGLTGAELRDGARAYTRAFIAACRPGAADKMRQVAPLELQFDQGGRVDAFRAATWERLHTAATARDAARQAVDRGPIGTTLGFTTRMSAAELLDRSPVEPLAGFVRAGLRPNGTLLLDLATVDPVIADAGARMTGLRAGYVANLLAINAAEQRVRDAAAVGSVRAESDVVLALIAVIKETKEKQKTLDEKIGGVKEGVGGTIAVLAFLAKGLDDGLAADLAEFGTIAVTMLDGMQKAAKGAIAAAEFLAGLEKVSKDLVIAGTGVGLAFIVVAVVIQVTGLLGKSRPIEEVILEELRKIARQVTELRDEMHLRFDRIDRKLDLMYTGLLDRLADIDFTLGKVLGDAEAIQRGLYDLSGALQRLNRDVHAFLNAGHRRDLVETINGYLDFVELTGQPLDFDGFRTAENVFFSWSRDHAKDELQAGPAKRDFGEDDVFGELALPLATNVNYLREAPAALFGLAPLAQDRLANPFDWIVAAEAYAQLSEESPDHAARISPARVDDLIAVGEALGAGLAECADMTLLCQVIGTYQRVFTRLKATIGGATGTFLGDPNSRLFGVDPWGGPDQLPGKNFFTDRYGDLRRCDGERFDPRNPTVPRDPVTFGRRQTDALRPFLIADNLSTSRIPGVASGLRQLSVCVDAKWNLVTLEDVPLGGRNLVTAGYRLSIRANVRYGNATVLRNEYDTGEKFQITLKRDEVSAFDPVTDRRGRNPYPLFMNLSDPDDPQSQGKFWQQLGTYRVTRGTVDPALRRTVTDEVRRRLVLVQRGLYGEVARRFTAEGDAVQRLGRRLTGVRRLMQAFVTTGLPLSAETDDLLRSSLFGSEAILGGVPESGGAALDNVRDVYLFFANRKEDPPAGDILPDVQELAGDRMNVLTTVLLEIIGAIDRGESPPQAPELFAPTLLRLELLRD